MERRASVAGTDAAIFGPMPDDAPVPESSDSAPVESADLLPVIYEELRRLARGHVARESGPQTLTATALVHEAWLRVSGDEKDARLWQNRRHFFGAAAEAMRRILIDRAREKLAAKRGGGAKRVAIDEAEIVAESPDEELLAVHEALARLTAEDVLAGEIVSLRYFAGLTWTEIAELTGMSERDLQRQWHYARTWLHAEISAMRG